MKATTLSAAQDLWEQVPDYDEEDNSGVIVEQIRIAQEHIGRAERALQAGDQRAATDLLGSAVAELMEVATGEHVA